MARISIQWKKNSSSTAFFFLKVLLLGVFFAWIIHLFLMRPFIVEGKSMEPFYSHGDYLFVDVLSYKMGSPERGDVVVFRPENHEGKHYIKRIIGLPGETVFIRNGVVSVLQRGAATEIILDEPYIVDSPDLVYDTYNPTLLGEDEYFVIGDNRAHSADSREFGPVAYDMIIGKVFFRLYPLTEIALVESHTYPFE